jgi:hypothetical protein
LTTYKQRTIVFVQGSDAAGPKQEEPRKMTKQSPETKKPETREEEHERKIKQGRISFLSAGATRKR